MRDCEKSVPVLNRTMHSLVCERRESPGSTPAENASENNAADSNAADSTVASSIAADGRPNRDTTELESVPSPSASSVLASESTTPSPAAAMAPAEQNFPVECEFCDLPVQVQFLEAHSSHCGARTDVCELCLNYVRLRDMRVHKDSGCTVASTGSAMRSALDDGYPNENAPLIGNPRAVDPSVRGAVTSLRGRQLLLPLAQSQPQRL